MVCFVFICVCERVACWFVRFATSLVVCCMLACIGLLCDLLGWLVVVVLWVGLFAGLISCGLRMLCCACGVSLLLWFT